MLEETGGGEQRLPNLPRWGSLRPAALAVIVLEPTIGTALADGLGARKERFRGLRFLPNDANMTVDWSPVSQPTNPPVYQGFSTYQRKEVTPWNV
jgi:hypothetical protein